MIENPSFTVNQKNIFSILSAMQPICTRRTTVDTTSMIFFKANHKELILKSTDLEISLQVSCLLQQSTLDVQPLIFLVSGKRIFDLIKDLEGDITISYEHNQLLITAGAVRLFLNTKDAAEFPSFPERIENLMECSASFLLELFNKVAFLIPQNNAHAALNGLLFEVSESFLRMTTTDGHCLAQVTSPLYHLATPHQWLLPRRAIFELKKILEGSKKDEPIFLGTCGSQLVFSGESFNFFTKLLTNSFPQYSHILDRTSFIPASIDRSHLVKTLRRSSCLLSGSFIATRFNFCPETVHVSMENKEVGKLHEQIMLEEFSGDAIDIRFYAPYLLNGLQSFSHDQVRFYLKSSGRPIIFDAENEDYHFVYLVMPVAPHHGT